MIEWLFFDVGFTLVDETKCYQNHAKRCMELLVQRGIDITEQEYLHQMIEASKQGLKPIKTLRDKYQLPKVSWEYDGEVLYEDAIATLEELSQNYQLGIIANQGKGLIQRLKQYGLSAYFDVIIASDEVGLKKPAAEIFQYALKEAKTLAEHSVYIGDRCDNDIIPAKKIRFYHRSYHERFREISARGS